MVLAVVAMAEGASRIRPTLKDITFKRTTVDGVAGGANPAGRGHGFPGLVGEGVEVVGLVMGGGLVVLALEDTLEVKALEVRQARPQRREQ